MSEEAETELRRTVMRNRLSSIGACLAFLLLGGSALYFTVLYIAGDLPVQFITYTAPAEDAAPTNQPVAQQMSAKSSPASAEVTPNIIVAQGTSSMVMAPVVLDTADGVDISPSVDLGMGIGMGDLGDGLGEGGGGLGSGTAGGSALEGTFYDLKLTKAGASTGITWNSGINQATPSVKTLEIIANFIKNWSPAALDKYYKSKTKLYASNFLLPSCSAKYAPIAYQCDLNKVKPGAWVAVYRGKVRAPKSGKFRFVGTGDDLLCVRFNRKMVLEAGWAIPSLFKELGGAANTLGSLNTPKGKEYHQKIKDGKDRDHKGYEFITGLGTGKWDNEIGGLTAGEVFEVKEGQAYPIEILISEIPGGAFGFALLIEELDSKGNSDGKKNFDAFRTNFSLPDKNELQKLVNEAKCSMGAMQMPRYNQDSLIWTAVP